jgi:peptidoglycan hydrolase-like protein with peptidoglycan-binding domain
MTMSAEVISLQSSLNKLGLTRGKKLSETGKIDDSNELAIQAFQRITNLYTDGIAGAVTLSMLAAFQELVKNPQDLPNLRENHAGGTLVNYLQYLLQIPITGIYDKATTAAVERFQDDGKGIVGSPTWMALLSLAATSTTE